jgi:ligand-binding sensor domain-containing protein
MSNMRFSRAFRRAGGRLALLAAGLSGCGGAWAAGAPLGNPAPAPPGRQVLLCEQVSATEGLSQSSVRGILQDAAGFIWIGTEGGLNRYDGQRIVAYKRDVRNPNSLSHNIIRALCLGRDGILWLGTESGGLNRFEPRSERFAHYRHQPGGSGSLSHDMVQALCLDKAGILWAGTDEGGLNRLDPKTGAFRILRHDPARPESLPHDSVTAICEDSRGFLWVGTLGGLGRLDRRTGRFTVYRHDPADPASLVNDRVQSLCEGRPGELWVGTEAGLSRFDSSRGRFETCAAPHVAPGHVPFHLVRALLRDRAGRIWIGTWDGLFRYDPATGLLTSFRLFTSEAHPSAGEEILSLFEDRSGVVWIGTSFGGALRVNPVRELFRHHEPGPEPDGSYKQSMISALAASRDGTVWLGSAGESRLHRLDPGGAVVSVPLPAQGGDLFRFPLYAILPSRIRPEILWLGTAGGGLLRFDRGRATASSFGPDPSHPGALSGEYVWAIHESADETLWVGTVGGGLSRWLPGRREFRRYQHDPADPGSLSNDNVLCIYEAPSSPGLLWIGTAGGGLNRFDPAAGRFQRFGTDPADPRSLSDNSVAAILEAPGQPGILWLGTGDGLDRFDSRTGRCRRYGRRDGLADNAVAGILPDTLGRLWISTLRGLSCFDPKTERFLNYDAADGLRSGEYNRAACCRAPDGALYFGGIRGVTSFRPESIAPNAAAPPVALTVFEVFGRSVGTPGEIPAMKSATLPHDQNFLSFEFAALDFRAPGRNQYACRLEGLDRGWVACGTRGFARYPGLEPGRYTLRVRAANNDGVWNRTGLALPITITPPFWRTGWFTGLALVVFALVSYAGISLAKKYFMLFTFWKRRGHIGRYRIVEELGRGGSGTVYKAADPADGSLVALKVLDAGLIDDAGRRRFIQEGLICERLHHPNVVKVHARGESQGRLFYAMEFVDGITLRRWIAAGRPARRISLAIFSALLDILWEIHQAGIIHRDVKPENVMFSGARELDDGAPMPELLAAVRQRLKILDFGLARIQDAATLTRTSLLAGTLQYIPPEHLFGKKIRESGYDFYSLGVMGYELITGRLPFQAEESFEVIAAILREEPVPPAELVPGVPPALSELVLRLIAKKPSGRWQEYDRIRAALDAVIEGWE